MSRPVPVVREEKGKKWMRNESGSRVGWAGYFIKFRRQYDFFFPRWKSNMMLAWKKEKFLLFTTTGLT